VATEVVTLWWITLAIALVVVLVVALLLLWIIAAANRIDRHALAIWEAGKGIAANTVQIWQLQRTNATAQEIAGTVRQIATVAESIDRRLERLAETQRGRA
jgi:lipopolysaccharide export LptBFGC system permease protein LptF